MKATYIIKLTNIKNSVKVFNLFDNDNKSFLSRLKINCSIVDESTNIVVKVKIKEFSHNELSTAEHKLN